MYNYTKKVFNYVNESTIYNEIQLHTTLYLYQSRLGLFKPYIARCTSPKVYFCVGFPIKNNMWLTALVQQPIASAFRCHLRIRRMCDRGALGYPHLDIGNLSRQNNNNRIRSWVAQSASSNIYIC